MATIEKGHWAFAGFTLALLLTPTLAKADANCVEAAKGYVFFEAKRGYWRPQESLQIMDCGNRKLELVYTEVKTKKVLDRTPLKPPYHGLKWKLDESNCHEREEDPNGVHRNKAVLFTGASINESTFLQQAWAVNPETKKLVSLPAATLKCQPAKP